MPTKSPTHSCYTVRDAGTGKKGFWVEIGAAWTNKDGSLSVKLDALPVNGEIVIQPRKDAEN
jgi:hypothetical protein